jgi:hypothetical protein
MPVLEVGTVDMKLGAVALPISDVDRGKAFYQSCGCRRDTDIAVADILDGYCKLQQAASPRRWALAHPR